MKRMQSVTIFFVSLGFFLFLLNFLGLHEYYASTKLFSVVTVVTKGDIKTVNMSRHDMPSLTSTPTPNLTSDLVVDVTEISNNVNAAKPSHMQQQAVKFYAIHIGPSKTGTSVIQKDLSCIPFEANTTGEDKDRVIYVGKRDQNGCREGEIWKINAHSISPKQEQKMYLGVTTCVQKILDGYYDQRSRNESKRAAIDKHLETNEETRASLRLYVLIKSLFHVPLRCQHFTKKETCIITSIFCP